MQGVHKGRDLRDDGFDFFPELWVLGVFLLGAKICKGLVSSIAIASGGGLTGHRDRGINFENIGHYGAKSIFIGRVPLNRGSEFILTFENLPEVLFTKKAVEVVPGNHDPTTLFDKITELSELGICGPDLGGSLNFFLGLVFVSFQECCLGSLDGHVTGKGIARDCTFRLGRWEILGGLLERRDQLFSLGVILGLHRVIQFEQTPDVELDSAFLLKFEGGYRGEILPNEEGFEKTLLGGVKFVALKKKVDGLHGLIDLLNRLIGDGVEGRDRWVYSETLAEHFGDIGVLINVESRVSILPDLVIEA